MLNTRDENKDWKKIKGYDNYEINKKGQIKSLKKNIILKVYSNNNGYKYVDLYNKGKKRKFLVHRLVALTFLDKVKGKNEVNHKNGIKSDNKLENIERCNRSENGIHKYRVLKIKHHMLGKPSYKARKKILQYDLCGKFIKKYNSLTEAGKSVGVTISRISECLHGNQHTAGGYKRKFFKT